MLPYSAELRLAQIPYITISIILLCLIIHYFQDQNRTEVASAIDNYCAEIYDESSHDPIQWLNQSEDNCRYALGFMHSQPDKERFIRIMEEYNEEEQEYSDNDFAEVVEYTKEQYARFSETAPASMESRVMYDPAIPNPFRMISSTLSHADWWHIIGNLIFFIAFTPVLEALAGSFLKFLGVVLLITLVTSVTYSITSYASGEFVPSLGLSGVVMGMIGFSGYMMPKARIRTVIWFFFFARVFSIPAWILAAWYIGWDTYDLFSRTDNGGVNLVAHVSGGIAGYLSGILWFKARREEYQQELDDEIEIMKCERQDKLGILSSSKAGQERMANQWREHRDKKAYADYMARLYQLIKTAQDSDAILLMLKNYDLYYQSPEIYEEHFQELKHARQKGKAILCLGRLAIHLLLQQKRYAPALTITRECLERDPEFAFAEPADLDILVKYALDLQEEKLVYQLITNIRARYGNIVDSDHYVRMAEQLKLQWAGLSP